jgi:hypothetical protein
MFLNRMQQSARAVLACLHRLQAQCLGPGTRNAASANSFCADLSRWASITR